MEKYSAQVAALESAVLEVDEHGELTVRPGNGGVRVSVAPELWGEASSCDEPVTGTSLRVPVLVHMKTLAPLLDPARWSEFTTLQMSNQRVAGGCTSGLSGWSGTIDETLQLDVFGQKQTMVNRLSIDFCYSDAASNVEFGLDESISGGITVDHGYVRAEPAGLLDLPEMFTQKTVNWAPGSPPCKLPREINRLILSAGLTLGVVGYSLKVLLAVHRAGANDADAALHLEREHSFVTRLGELGVDLARGRWLPHSTKA